MAIVKEISPEGRGCRMSIITVSLRTHGKRKKGLCAFVPLKKMSFSLTILATSYHHFRKLGDVGFPK